MERLRACMRGESTDAAEVEEMGRPPLLPSERLIPSTEQLQTRVGTQPASH